jgi:hypothetical protein
MFEAIFAIYSLLPVRLKGKVRNILSKRCAAATSLSGG